MPDTYAFPNGNQYPDNTGLTKREYAAIHIFAGLASDHKMTDYDAIRQDAIAQADLLLAYLAATEK